MPFMHDNKHTKYLFIDTLLIVRHKHTAVARWLSVLPLRERSWVQSPTASYQKRSKKVPHASLLSVQHMWIGLASLFYQTSCNNVRWIPYGIS